MTHINRYTCEEAFRRLDDYLDHELSAEEMVLIQEHLDICAGCAGEFNFESSVLRGVGQKLQQIQLPETLQSRILELLKTERQRD